MANMMIDMTAQFAPIVWSMVIGLAATAATIVIASMPARLVSPHVSSGGLVAVSGGLVGLAILLVAA